jgi:Xaa-Pro aminopeptidase
MNRVTERLSRLRAWMTEHSVDAVIIFSADPHQSEYPPEHHLVRAWISGFSGSAGTVVVTQQQAGLWTDSRYFLEAERVTAETEFQLFRLHTPGTVNHVEWTVQTLSSGSTVAVDYRTITLSAMSDLRHRCDKRNVEIVDTENLFDQIWEDRPPLPTSPLFRVSEKTTGESAIEKLARIRRSVMEQQGGAHIIGTLDDIAWVLNLRGGDVPYNPVFLAYLIITPDKTTLYTATQRVPDEVRRYLEEIPVAIREYDDFFGDVQRLPGPVVIDPERLSYAVARTWPEQARIEIPQPSTAMKARKTDSELASLREAMRIDGAAMVRFLHWFDENGIGTTELDAAKKLRDFRGAVPEYVGDSFNYISGFNGNGAIVHYAADEESNTTITPDGIYLIDSGGQYQKGTTDITRTVPTGAPDPEAVRDFTLVLKGHIALSTLVFPAGTSGRDIDVIARRPLWDQRVNYGHGTGHGVGFFLNVHEGPQRIAPAAPDWPLEAGMIVSNEPGLYRQNRWGIRIENLLAVQPAEAGEFGSFLSFETLTLCPVDRRLMDISLLSSSEREWVDRYHRRVRSELTPMIDSAETRQWLETATRPLGDGVTAEE